MFKIFPGFHLVEALHLQNAAKRFTHSHYIKMVLCSLLSLAVALIPAEWFGIAGLTPIEQRVIAMFVFAATMWITEAMPAWGTSFLVIVIMLLTISDAPLSCFKVAVEEGQQYGNPVSYKSLMATLSDPTIMLFLGGFVLAIGMIKTKFDSFLAKAMLVPFGSNPKWILLGFIIVTGLFSGFVSNTATAAMMLTFLAPVLKSMNDMKGRAALALAIPLGANIGGMMTPIGTPPNVIALAYLNETLGYHITFGDWILRMAPITFFLLLAGWMVLLLLFPFKEKEIHLKIEGEFQNNKDTWVVIGTFAVTVFLWCFADLLNLGLNSNIIALIPVAVFIISGIFDRRDLEEINWGVLWMVAGGFALGLALNKTGLSTHMIEAIPFGTWSFYIVVTVAVLICYGLSNFISNSATAALLVPVLGVVAGSMATATGDASVPMRMLIAIAVAASVAMMLPISTPPNAIAHSTGMIEQKDMVKMGIIVGLIGLVAGVGWLILVF